MTINHLQNLSSLMTAFAASRPTQMAFLAGMFSFLLHIWVWQAWQTAALKTEPVVLSQRIEVALISPEPKQPVPIIQPKPELPAPKVIENPKPKVIPKTTPIVKSPPKLIQKISERVLPKTNPPMAKRETSIEPSKVSSKTNEAAPGGSAGGYGIASKTGQGIGSSIGLSGGFGNGTGGGSGTGSGNGKGSEANNDIGKSTGLTKGVVVLERTQPEYPPRALTRGIEGYVTVDFTIKANGELAKLTIVSAEPSDIFIEAALTAIKKWKFKQKTVNGVVVEQRARQTFAFKLNYNR